MLTTNNPYYRQLDLLVEVLRDVASEDAFALKGGTAINLFFRDLPRLSVDIDLAWLPLTERAAAMQDIADGLARMRAQIERRLRCRVRPRANGAGIPTGLAIERAQVRIKIDVTPVLRGAVFEPERRIMQPAAQQAFGFLEMQTLGFADVYAGKLVATLDRQHPRDLFDVMHLLAGEGLTDELWSAFLVYLVSHNRPAAELLNPRRKDLAMVHTAEFAGMTIEPVMLTELENAREDLFARLHERLDEPACAFLLAMERETPDWSTLRLPAHVANLPAVRWKLHNLARRTPIKREADYRQLLQALERIGRGEG